MDARSLDIRTLVIKYDLEKALSEIYHNEKQILNDYERKILKQYDDHEYEILEYIRDLLIDSESHNEIHKLFHKVNESILKDSEDLLFHQQVVELEDAFITSIEENTANNKCLFLPKSIIMK